MKKLLTMTVALTVLTTFSGLATAATSVKASKSNQSERTADKASPKLMTGKVTAVNPVAKTFTVMSNGQAVTFSAAKLPSLPIVGQILDITYTQTPGGPMEIRGANLNLSKSNIN